MTRENRTPDPALLAEDERMIGRLPDSSTLINDSAFNRGLPKADQDQTAKKTAEQFKAMLDEADASPPSTQLRPAFPLEFTREGLLAALRAGLRFDGLAAVCPPARLRAYEKRLAESADQYHGECREARADYDERVRLARADHDKRERLARRLKDERERMAILELLGL